MLDETLTARITQIHADPSKLVFEFAGAGSQALYWLHSVGGSSRTILEATDRYAATSMVDLLGAAPETFVSQETAVAMAGQAYHRAVRLAADGVRCLGVACTATIATDRVKRGDHGCWIAVCDAQGTAAYGLVLSKGARDRAGEEEIVSRLTIRAIALASGVADDVPVELLPSEQLQTVHIPGADPIALLLDGTAQTVTVAPDGTRTADAPFRGALLSGSFNPLHQGHERLASAASETLGLPAAFELPVANADKPPLSYSEIERRLAQFRFLHTVLLSRAPLFVQKAELFPGCTFVLGYDTAARLVEPRYYGGLAERDAALQTIQARGCRFLVAGRVDADGAFRTLRDITVPPGFEGLFVELPEQAFRVDLSSTAIRASQLNTTTE